MGYQKIDLILDAWARSHQLYIYRTYRDVEVRSVEVVNRDGKRFQIWIDLPDSTNRIGVHAWDYKTSRTDISASPDTLFESLEKAYRSTQD
jgi:hypothetical protein